MHLVEAQSREHLASHFLGDGGVVQHGVEFLGWHRREDALLQFEPKAWHGKEHRRASTLEVLDEDLE
jgi:hypothetical protein